MKTEDVMDSLLKMGVQKGVITCQDLNEAFPAEFFPLEEMERFLHLLEDMGIQVIDLEDKERRRRRLKKGQDKGSGQM